MFPYLEIWGGKVYMTGVGIVLGFIAFLIVGWYMTNKYRQSFGKIFYWLPLLIILTYILGAYTQFVFDTGLYPSSFEELWMLLSPYGYKFNFMGVLLGVTISIHLFMKKIRMYQAKKVRIDIFFFSLALALVPMGLFFVLGDNFIGFPTEGFLGIKALHQDSALNKFYAVYPTGLFLAAGSLITAIVMYIWRKRSNKIGLGILGFGILIIVINIVLLFQQYPRYGVIGLGNITFDIKQYLSFLIVMLCLYTYNKRNRE